MPTDAYTPIANVLLGASQDYRHQTLAREAEDRQRTNRLADIDSERQYQGQIHDRNRLEQQQDEVRHVQNDIKLQLVHEGLLEPTEMQDEEKVAKAFKEAQRRGLDVLYNELLTTMDPDTNQPVMSRMDLQNPEAIDAAKARLAVIKGERQRFADVQPANAQKELDRLGGESDQIQGRLQQIEQTLNQPQPQPSATEIAALSVKLATQANGGKTPSRDKIEAFSAQAMQELQGRLDMKWAQDKQDAQLQERLLHDRLLTNQQRSAQLSATFKVAPTPNRVAPIQQSGMISPPARQASPEERQAMMAAALKAALGGNTPDANPKPDATSPLANPTNDPTIAKENDRTAGKRWKSNLADPYTAALDQVQAVQQQINQVQQGGGRMSPYQITGDSGVPDASTAGTAATLSNLLMQKQALDRKADEAKRAMLGLRPDQVLANPLSTGGASTPTSFTPASSLRNPVAYGPN